MEYIYIHILLVDLEMWVALYWADFFIIIGVFMMASASQIWRATGGRFNSDFFKYKIGGEW
jgi:hypothetical protein